jgi:hypothetical protein
LPNADVVDLAAYKAKSKTAGQAPNLAGAPGEIRTRAPASGGRNMANWHLLRTVEKCL